MQIEVIPALPSALLLYKSNPLVWHPHWPPPPIPPPQHSTHGVMAKGERVFVQSILQILLQALNQQCLTTCIMNKVKNVFLPTKQWEGVHWKAQLLNIQEFKVKCLSPTWLIKPESLLSRVFAPLVLRFITTKTHTIILRRQSFRSRWPLMVPWWGPVGRLLQLPTTI